MNLVGIMKPKYILLSNLIGYIIVLLIVHMDFYIGFQKMLIGSVAEKVVRYAKTPVLVVK